MENMVERNKKLQKNDTPRIIYQQSPETYCYDLTPGARIQIFASP